VHEVCDPSPNVPIGQGVQPAAAEEGTQYVPAPQHTVLPDNVHCGWSAGKIHEPVPQVAMEGEPEKTSHSAIEAYPSLNAPTDSMIMRNIVYDAVDEDHTVKDCF
jgi:hypothetical protein